MATPRVRPPGADGAGCQMSAGGRGGRGRGPGAASCCDAARGRNVLNALHLLQPLLGAPRHMSCASRVAEHPEGLGSVIWRRPCRYGLGDEHLQPRCSLQRGLA